MDSDLPSPDVAVLVGKELLAIRATLKEADEVYRLFRATMIADPPRRQDMVPVEWIPISDR
jgi:hypothetical protein